jgi:hypothetical protein
MAVPFPAFCPHCGLIFDSHGLKIEGEVRGLTLAGNKETCPRCGQWAELPDGTFNVVDDTIQVLTASRLTTKRLLRLQAILEQANAGFRAAQAMTDASVQAVSEAVVDEAPELRPLLERYGPKMQAALLFLLALIVQTLIQQGVAELRDDSVTRGDVRRAVERAVEQSKQDPPQDQPRHGGRRHRLAR